MLAILFSIDPAFFYPRIETDQLLYLLKAKSLVETGSTAARSYVNADPFAYAAMPGVLRAPFLLMFDEFDNQLRAMQVMNVAIVAATAMISAYIFSWALPRRLHRFAIGFAFAFVVLSPDWLANTFVPLADAPYALLTLACLVISASVLSAPQPVASRRLSIALFIALFITAFQVRFTAPALLVPVALLARGRWSEVSISRRAWWLIIGVPALFLVVLVILNAQAIFGRYIVEPFLFVLNADKTGMGLNVFGSAIPSQIIPVFNLGFDVMPPANKFQPVFGTTVRDSLWTAAGLLISGITAIGLVRSASRILPEAAYLLVVLPVLGAMIPSTTRYLMAYQPILWFMFAAGAAFLLQPWKNRLGARHLRIAAALAAILAATGLVALRSARVARTAGGAVAPSALERPLRYTSEVATTFRGLRDFLETLPAERALLVSGSGEAGRWAVIAGRPNYRPDSLLLATVREKEVYTVLSCGSPEACAPFEEGHEIRAKRLAAHGDFTYEKVFEQRTGSARATVHRMSVSPVPGPAGEPGQSASGRTAR